MSKADVLIEGFPARRDGAVGAGAGRAARSSIRGLSMPVMTGWGQDGVRWRRRQGTTFNYIAITGALSAVGQGRARLPK